MKQNLIIIVISLLVGIGIGYFLFHKKPTDPITIVDLSAINYRDSIIEVQKNTILSIRDSLVKSDSTKLYYKKQLDILKKKYNEILNNLQSLTSNEQVELFLEIYTGGTNYTDSTIVGVQNCYNANIMKYKNDECNETLQYTDSINQVNEKQINDYKKIDSIQTNIIYNDSITKSEYKQKIDTLSNSNAQLNKQNKTLQKRIIVNRTLLIGSIVLNAIQAVFLFR